MNKDGKLTRSDITIFIITGILIMIAVAYPVEAANATNTSGSATRANMSWDVEAVFWNASGGTTYGIFGGENYMVTGAILVLIMAFMAFRFSVSLDLIAAFFIPLIIILAMAGFLPSSLAIVAVIIGGVIIGLALLQTFAR